MNAIGRLLKFGQASLKHAADGFAKLPLEMYEERLKICQSCDKFNEETWQCNECSCYLTIKAEWRSESCPLKKWPGDEAKAESEKPKKKCGGCAKRKIIPSL